VSLATVAALCHRLDGIPLAIELAAARIKMLTPEQIAARMDNRFQLLTGGCLDRPPHHRTHAAMLDWSFRLLSEEDRNSLHRLAAFVGGWSLEAAGALLGTGELIAMIDLPFGFHPVITIICASLASWPACALWGGPNTPAPSLRCWRW